MKFTQLAAILLLPFSLNAFAAGSPSAAGASVYIVSPAHGEVVATRVKVIFGLSGMGVAPAGVEVKETGHHHLLIDVDELPAMDVPLPATENIRHFGGGQTETTIDLPAGKHTVQLLLGNHSHIPHDPPVMSEKITITVVD